METQTIIQTAESSLLHTYNRFPIVLDRGEDVYQYEKVTNQRNDFLQKQSTMLVRENQ